MRKFLIILGLIVCMPVLASDYKYWTSDNDNDYYLYFTGQNLKDVWLKQIKINQNEEIAGFVSHYLIDCKDITSKEITTNFIFGKVSQEKRFQLLELQTKLNDINLNNEYLGNIEPDTKVMQVYKEVCKTK